MVAGFIAGYLENRNYEHALRLGSAAGSASAFSNGLAYKADIMKLYKELLKEGFS
jgi:1-phosphofructokinase